MAEEWQSAVARAQAHSPFLAQGLEKLPDLAALLAAGKGEEALVLAKSAGQGVEEVGSALRRERLAMAVALGIGDLAGAFPLTRVMDELSELADRALDAAIADAIRRRAPDAEPQGFSALALGKHGAGELNYSSDIDPILLYDPERLPRRARDEPGEAADRVARSVVETLSKVTHEGYVFRVDLRLRPASEVSPLAISFDAALSHYESSALAWERAAYIRARACAGDIVAGEAFLASIRPFVWRRSLDFGAIEEIRRLTMRIRAHHGERSWPGPGFDLKLGRGGIREVEFFAQTHQLIHGGRKPSLRVRGTRAALDALAEEGLIDREDAVLLGESYDRLRTIEHRLQMVADRQTHELPCNAEALDNVARLDGLASGKELVSEIEGITAQVAQLYDTLLDVPDHTNEPTPAVGSALEARLRQLGFSEPERLATRVEGWSDGRVRALRSEAARAAFEAVFPLLIEAIGHSPDRDSAFNRWESLLANLPSAVNLFRLLEARPGLLDRLVRILTLAPPLADALSRRAELLDALIDASALDLPGSVDELAARMALPDGQDGYEELLDRVRRVVGETRFALGVQLIEAIHDPLEIAEALSRVAEAALAVCLKAAEEEFARVHGRIGGQELVVLGLGRLGGGALTHASDVDLIFLFGDGAGASADVQSDGERPLGVTLYFNRLAQRVSAALSVPTAEGPLYEIDTRLRPQGNQGPLSVSLSSFERYQKEDAWTWEHMALNRARVLAGPPDARAALERIMAEVLYRPRDAAKLTADVLKMRSEMAAHKHPAGELDAKLRRGGLVDLEFLIHYLQLRERLSFTPEMVSALGGLIDAGLLPESLRKAQLMLIRLLVAARLLAPDGRKPATMAACKALAKACIAEDYEALLADFLAARRAVAAAWQDIFGEELEIEP